MRSSASSPRSGREDLTTETGAPPEAGETGTVDERPALPAAADLRRERVLTRVLIPLVLPIAAALAVCIYVLNVSRIFIVAKHGGEVGDVIAGLVVTFAILAGTTYVAARPRFRTSGLTTSLLLVMLLIVSAGMITLERSVETEEEVAAAYVEPSGASVTTLTVEALASIKFDASEYTVSPGGVVEVDYVGAPGHTLVFDTTDANLRLFEEKLPGGPTRLKAELDVGSYTVFCSIPGHRAAGMEATLTVE